MGDFKDLRVWRQAHEMALHMYRVTQAGSRGSSECSLG